MAPVCTQCYKDMITAEFVFVWATAMSTLTVLYLLQFRGTVTHAVLRQRNWVGGEIIHSSLSVQTW